MKVAVVGAGILGTLCALRLQQEGYAVSIFEADKSLHNCSTAAAGLLAPMSELDKADEIVFTLGRESLTKLWPAILEQLPEPIYFQQKGSLIVHHPQDAAEWQQFSARIIQQLSPSCYELVDRQSLIQLEPELTQFNKAYFFAEEGQLDNQTLLSVLRNYLKVIWYYESVTTLGSGRVTTDNSTYHFDWVFDCRGLGAKDVFTDLRGLRGELIWLHAPEVKLQRPVRLLHPRYTLYIAPRPDSTYLIGASELETEDLSGISVRTTLELLTAAYYVHRGFAEARVIKTVTHCRPTLVHHKPRIKYTEGLTAVNGLYRHGYLLAPALVEEVMCGVASHGRDVRYPRLWDYE